MGGTALTWDDDIPAQSGSEGEPRGAHDLIVAATATAAARTPLTTDGKAAFDDLPGADASTRRSPGPVAPTAPPPLRNPGAGAAVGPRKRSGLSRAEIA